MGLTLTFQGMACKDLDSTLHRTHATPSIATVMTTVMGYTDYFWPKCSLGRPNKISNQPT